MRFNFIGSFHFIIAPYTGSNHAFLDCFPTFLRVKLAGWLHRLCLPNFEQQLKTMYFSSLSSVCITFLLLGPPRVHVRMQVNHWY